MTLDRSGSRRGDEGEIVFGFLIYLLAEEEARSSHAELEQSMRSLSQLVWVIWDLSGATKQNQRNAESIYASIRLNQMPKLSFWQMKDRPRTAIVGLNRHQF